MKKKLRKAMLTVMRVFLLFIAFGLTSTYATSVLGQAKVDIDVNGISIEKLFQEIQSKSDYIFFYKDNVLKTNKKISLKYNNTEVSKILDEAFLNTDLIYKIIGKQIVVRKAEGKVLETAEVNKTVVEEKVVIGTVTDINGQPLIGVTVTIQGTTKGTQTNLEGKYSIKVKDDASLVFSFLGMTTQTIIVGRNTVLDIILKQDVKALGEVLIVGYGSQRKEAITGSVSVIKAADLEQAPVSTFQQSLRGSVAGVQASALDGAPGSNTEVRIRGIGSITASSEPLYVIDGIPIQAGSAATNDNNGASTNVLASINPNDIETITILKDAASTAIYGSRGANGVILITTKLGKKGKGIIDFKTLTGFNSQASTNILRPLNATQYTNLFLEGYINKGDTPAQAQNRLNSTFKQLTDPSTGKPTNTNWLDAITRVGVTQSYDLSARGGTDNVKYFFSGSYMNQESYIIGYGFDRFSTRSNLEYKANDFLTISNNISVSDIKSTTSFASGSFDNPFKNTLELSPLIPIYDEQGRFNGDHDSYFPLGGSNPVGSLSGADLWQTKQTRIIDNFAITASLIKNLKFRSQWNFDVFGVNESQYLNPRYGGGKVTKGYGYEATTTNKSWVGTQTLTYNFNLGKNHYFDILAGYEAQKSETESHSASGTQFPNEKVRTLNSASTGFAINGPKSEYTFLSLFSRANYNYADKYFISASLRRDGSSRFGADNRYGTFYSVGASWLATNENFLKDISFIDLIKLRGSYGITGNASIGNFPSLGLYTYGQDYDGVPGGSPSQIGNPNLTWERQNNFNVGLDFGFLKRISGTVEYFKRISSDLLLDVPISRTSGFTSLTQNFGEMENSGIELSLNADVLNYKDFKWNLGFNATFLKNKITKLPSNYIDGAYRREEGQDFQAFYLYSWAGVNQANGDPQWYTDDTKTAVTTDLAKAKRFLDNKSATPKYYGGINSTFSFKGLSLDVNFMYNYGNYLFDSRARGTLGDGRLTPRSTATWLYDNRWVPGKTDAKVPKFIWGGRSGSNEANNSRWLYDGSFLRLKDVTLAYKIPERINKLVHIGTSRLYLRGTNILTFTKVKDLYIDPEQAINGDYNALTPAMKTISIGLDVQF